MWRMTSAFHHISPGRGKYLRQNLTNLVSAISKIFCLDPEKNVNFQININKYRQKLSIAALLTKEGVKWDSGYGRASKRTYTDQEIIFSNFTLLLSLMKEKDVQHNLKMPRIMYFHIWNLLMNSLSHKGLGERNFEGYYNISY